MSYHNTINLFKRYFERQIKLAQKSLKREEMPHHPFVTISRQTGAGNVQFPEKLVLSLNEKDKEAKKNWMLFDKNILEAVLEEHDLPKEISKYMPEKKISEIQDVLEQLFGLHPSERKLVKEISDTIIHLAHFGNVVLVGRGSNLITQSYPNGLHIRIISSIDSRIENMRRYFKMTRNAAIKLIKKEDKDRSSYIKKYFSKDVNDPSMYSMILNFDFISISDSIDMITEEVLRIRKKL